MKIIIILCGIIGICSYNQLSFSGGGSFGALEIGILKRLIETDKKSYDLYTGISVGAINAGCLSYYSDMEVGIKNIEKLYCNLKNRNVYDILPHNGLSLLNSNPLYNTLFNLINNMENDSIVDTYIGMTNMYTGKLDIYNFKEKNNMEKVLLLMSSSAIPGIFPPVKYKTSLYADGGILSNELIDIKHDNSYLNITYITPYEDFNYNNVEIKSFRGMLCRTAKILLNNYNDPLVKINQDCKNHIGEINKYYVPYDKIKKYNILNFDKGSELINIGYNNMMHKKYKIC
jgi:predicted patatin/cPLA2 family phospholipase